MIAHRGLRDAQRLSDLAIGPALQREFEHALLLRREPELFAVGGFLAEHLEQVAHRGRDIVATLAVLLGACLRQRLGHGDETAVLRDVREHPGLDRRPDAIRADIGRQQHDQSAG